MAITNLQIKIKTNADSAAASLEKLRDVLAELQVSVNNVSNAKVDASGITRAANTINKSLGSVKDKAQAVRDALQTPVDSGTTAQTSVKAEASAAAKTAKASKEAEEKTSLFTKALKNVAEAAKSAAGSLSSMLSNMGSVGGVFNSLVSSAGGLVGVFANLFSANPLGALSSLGSAVGSLGGMFKSLAASGISKAKDSLLDLGNAAKKITSPIASLASSMWRLTKLRIMRGILRSITSGMSEGLQTIYKYSSAINGIDASSAVNTLNSLATATSYLSNSVGALGSSFLDTFMPIIETVVNAIVEAINWVNQLFAVLGGRSSYTVAVPVAQTYADAADDAASSMGKAADAAEEYKATLLGIDEINKLDDPNEGSSGSGGGSGSGGLNTDFSTYFKEVEVDSALTDMWDAIKEAFENGDYEEIGRIIARGLNTVTQTVDDWINGTFRPAGVKWAGIIAEILNGLVDEYDWALLGKTIADGISSIADITNTFLTTLDWTNLGVKISEGLNSLVETVDWELIGTAIGSYFQAQIEVADAIVTGFDWEGLGTGLGEGVNSAVETIDFEQAGHAMSTGWAGVFETLCAAITETDWKQIGASVGDYLNGIDFYSVIYNALMALASLPGAILDFLAGVISETDWVQIIEEIGAAVLGFLKNFDWAGLFRSAAEFVGAAIGALFDIGNWLDEAVANLCWSIVDYFASYIDIEAGDSLPEIGLKIILGILQGILDFFANIGAWIRDNIFIPFIEGFKSIFGISSPSTVMSELGNYLVEGLLNGITAVWDTITNFFSGALEGLGNLLSYAWEGMKIVATTVWNGISTVATTVWDGISTTVCNAASGIASWAGEKWEELKSDASAVWSATKEIASTVWDGISTTVTDAASNIATWAGEKWEGMKSAASTAWEGIKGFASSIWDGITTTISDATQGIVDNVSGDLSGLAASAPTWGSDLCSNLASGIKGAISTVTSAVSSVASKIASFLGFSEPDEGPLSKFHTFMPDMLSLMAEGIYGNTSVAISAVEALGEQMSDKMSDISSDMFSDISASDMTVNGEAFGAFSLDADSGSDAVAGAIYDTGAQTSTLLKSVESLLTQLLDKDMTAVISTTDISSGFNRANRRAGRTVFST